MSILATKRRLSDLDPTPSTQPTTCRSSHTFKRSRHSYPTSNPQPQIPSLNISALLNSPPHAHQLSASRHNLLTTLHFTPTIFTLLFQLLNHNIPTLLTILDVNLYQDNILSVVRDYAERGIPLTRLNIRGHSFSTDVKQAVLHNFNMSYRQHAFVTKVVEFLAKFLFASDHSMSVAVFSGGGIRDILLADWCRLYRVSAQDPPPQLIVITAFPSNRSFLVPYIAQNH